MNASIATEHRTLAALAVTALAVAYWAVVYLHPAPIDRVVVDQVTQLNGAIVDRPATPFTLTDLEGRQHSLESLEGSVIFLNFWATWCPPCVEEMPSMRTLSERFRGRPFRMVAVTQDDDMDALVAFLTAAGFTGDEALILRDPDGALARAYGTRLLPETYVIDREGTVVARFMGARDWLSEPSLRLFERLMLVDARGN